MPRVYEAMTGLINLARRLLRRLGRRADASPMALLALLAPLAVFAPLAAALALALSPAPAAAQAQPQASVAPSFQACADAVDDGALLTALQANAKDAMRTASRAIDYRRVVEQSWLAVRFDRKFANIVDAKIAILREDRDYLQRLLDGNIPSRAREMAERTADLVFQSPEFAALQIELQAEIGRRLEPEVAAVETQARTLASACVNTFMKRRFAESVQGAFAAEVGRSRVGGQLGVGGGVSGAAAISLAGVVSAILVVVFRRLVRRIVSAVIRRMAGAIAARLAAWASVVAGALLLAYELVAGADGVFPIIRDELTSPQTRVEMQTALIDDLASVAPERLDARALEIAQSVYARWTAFKTNHAATLALAAREPDFQRFLDGLKPEQFEALSVTAATLRGAGGDAAVLAQLRSGALAEAVATPGFAPRLETWTAKGLAFEDVLAWARLAGPSFPAVMDSGLPATLKPTETTRAELDAIARLDDPAAARLVAALPKEARAEALATEPARVRKLAARYEPAEAARLLRAVRPVDDPARRWLYLDAALADPARARALLAAEKTVAASRSPREALDLVLDPAPLWSPFAVVDHIETVGSGVVGPMALVHRYGWEAAALAVIPALIVLGLLRWALGILLWLLRPLLWPFRRRKKG